MSLTSLSELCCGTDSITMTTLKELVPPGVVTGDDLMKLLTFAKENQFAIPAVNCTSSSTVNAVLEAAKIAQSPVMIQFSEGGGAFYAGKALSNKGENASIIGSIAGAYHVRLMAKHYGVPVVLHSDHCAKKLLPWLDGMLAADKEYFQQHGEPLFSSHMIDLSEEPLNENIELTAAYLAKCKAVNCLLEMELGITGGEEDGVDNTGVDNDDLYSKPEEVFQVFKTLSEVTDRFTVAAAFGNVHGVYAPGNVRLHPEKLLQHQAYAKEQLKCEEDKPIFFVFHGGSGSSEEDIKTAVSAGVVKMNIDTDTQWAYWDGLRKYEATNHGYLQGQIGNPEGPNKPNKKYYDPRIWIREAEKGLVERLRESFQVLGSQGKYA